MTDMTKLQEAAPATTPLAGKRVIDFTGVLAGPLGTMMLADLGAEVIKIEPPEGDQSRHFPHFDEENMSYYYKAVNRGKRSVVINLKSDEDRAKLFKLIESADVVLQNFRPSVCKKLKLDFEDVKKINPRIVYCSLTGFGNKGPMADRPAYDIVVQALSGGMSITGHPNDPKGPVRAGIPIVDMSGGLMSSLIVLLGLLIREQRGEAVRVDSSLLETQMWFLTYIAGFYLNKGIVPQPQGSGHPTGVVYQAFKTMDGFIVVVADLDAHFRKLCTALKLTDFLEDPSLATLRQRKERKPVVVERLTKIFLTDTVAAWKELLIANGVPCSPINSVGDILDDPHLREGLGQIVSQPGAAGKEFLSIGCPVRINEVRPMAKRPPPKMGEDQEYYFGSK